MLSVSYHHWWVTLTCLSYLLTTKLMFWTSFITVYLKGTWYAQATLKKWEFCFTATRAGNLHKLLGIHPQGTFISLLPFIHPVIYICGLMDVGFIHWIIIPYYFIFWLNLFQLCPLGVLSLGSCAPRCTSCIECMCMCECVLGFSSVLALHISPVSYIFIPFCSPGVSHFSKKLWFLLELY